MTKVISISDEAYNELTNLKGAHESFSKIVIKLTNKEKKKSILELAGEWKELNEMDKIFSDILERRHKSKWRT